MVLSSNGDASGLKLSGLGKEAPLPFWWIQGKASALKLLDVANNAKKDMPARGPLKHEHEIKKKRKSWDKVSKCVYGKAYPFSK